MSVEFVIGITGPIGVGKTTLSKAIACRYGASIVTMSTPIRAKLQELGVEQTREAMARHTKAKRIDNLEYWMEKTLKMMAVLETRIALIDGLRNPHGDLNCLRRAMAERVIVLGMSAEEDVLVERALRRVRSGDPIDSRSMRSAIREDSFSGGLCGSDIQWCLALADFVLDGNRLVEQVTAQAFEILDDRVPRLG